MMVFSPQLGEGGSTRTPPSLYLSPPLKLSRPLYTPSPAKLARYIGTCTLPSCPTFLLPGLVLTHRANKVQSTQAQFLVRDWGMELAMASGCRTGLPTYVAWKVRKPDAIAGFIS
jgi:hypothetical protein